MASYDTILHFSNPSSITVARFSFAEVYKYEVIRKGGPVNKAKICLAMEPKLTVKKSFLQPKKDENHRHLSEKWWESFGNSVFSC